jgi:hypothetical protein
MKARLDTPNPKTFRNEDGTTKHKHRHRYVLNDIDSLSLLLSAAQYYPKKKKR